MDVFQGCGTGFLLIDVDSSDVVSVKFSKYVKVSVVYGSEDDAIPEATTMAVTYGSEDSIPEATTMAVTLPPLDEAEHPDNDLVLDDSTLKIVSVESLKSVSRQPSINETNFLPSNTIQSFHCEALDKDTATKSNFPQVLDSIVNQGNTVLKEDSRCNENAVVDSTILFNSEMKENNSYVDLDSFCVQNVTLPQLPHELELSRRCELCSCKFENSFEFLKHSILDHTTMKCSDCGNECNLNAPCHQMTKLKDGSGRNRMNNNNNNNEILLPEETISNSDNDTLMKTEGTDTNVISVNEELKESFQTVSGVCTRRGDKLKHFKGRKCERCEKAFDSDVDYVKHQIVVHASLQCLDCGSGCLCKAHFMMHDESVTIDGTHVRQEELFDCPVCFELILTHMMGDPLNDGLFQCCSCQRVFQNCTSLIKHLDSNCKMKKETSDDRTKLKCKFCGRFFSSKVDLEKHKRAPAIIEVCGDCGFETKSKAILSLHQHLGHVKGKTGAILKCLPKQTVCPICGESCRRSHILKHIQLQHTKEYLYKCCVCGSSSNTDRLWAQHAECHLRRSNEDSNSLSKPSVIICSAKGCNSDNERLCLLCQQDFKNEKDFVSHHQNETKIQECDLCKIITFTEAGFIVHKYISHGVSPGEEEFLSNTISSTVADGKLWKEDVPFPDDIETETQSIKCPCCCDTFPISDLLFHIMDSHTKESPYKCCSCNSLSTSMHHHLDHCGFHLGMNMNKIGSQSFPCISCKLHFESRDAFLEHRKKLQCNIKECYQCKKTFASVSALDDHIQYRHTSVCSVCGKVFKSRKKFLDHEKRHTHTHVVAVKEKQCPKCGVMVKNLSGHMKFVHPTPSTKRFTCDLCGKQFLKNASLKKHESLHSTVRPYQCDVCLMKFKTHTHCQRHMKIHSERPMISCEVCGKKCATRTNMKIHMRVHATVKLFHCDQCGLGFNYKQSLLSHVKSKHENSTG